MGKAEERAKRRKEWWEKQRKKMGLNEDTELNTDEAGTDEGSVQLQPEINSQGSGPRTDIEAETKEVQGKKKRQAKKRKVEGDESLQAEKDSSQNVKDILTKITEESKATSKDTISKQKEKKPQKKLYTLFIGNLSYSVTKEDLEKHFIRTGGVKNVRLITDKQTGKSRGFAYIEFEDNKAFKFALMLHHTELDGRQINVEFTSIGGNNQRRKDKLKQKNEHLAKYKLKPEETYKSVKKKSMGK